MMTKNAAASGERKPNARTRRVLIVDDHPVVRQGVAMLIGHETDLEVCGEAEGLIEAMRLFNETSPHLVIIDISLKDGSGIELVKEIHARNANTRMLISSMHDEELFAERLLRAGAHGYVHKHEAVERIIDAARQVLEGRIYLSEVMSERLLHRLVSHTEVESRSPIETLSDRELEVFEMIGRGLTTRQIASRLDLSPKTIETYRENIKLKLDLQNSTALTKHAVQWTLENS